MGDKEGLKSFSENSFEKFYTAKIIAAMEDEDNYVDDDDNYGENTIPVNMRTTNDASLGIRCVPAFDGKQLEEPSTDSTLPEVNITDTNTCSMEEENTVDTPDGKGEIIDKINNNHPVATILPESIQKASPGAFEIIRDGRSIEAEEQHVVDEKVGENEMIEEEEMITAEGNALFDSTSKEDTVESKFQEPEQINSIQAFLEIGSTPAYDDKPPEKLLTSSEEDTVDTTDGNSAGVDKQKLRIKQEEVLSGQKKITLVHQKKSQIDQSLPNIVQQPLKAALKQRTCNKIDKPPPNILVSRTPGPATFKKMQKIDKENRILKSCLKKIKSKNHEILRTVDACLEIINKDDDHSTTEDEDKKNSQDTPEKRKKTTKLDFKNGKKEKCKTENVKKENESVDLVVVQKKRRVDDNTNCTSSSSSDRSNSESADEALDELSEAICRKFKNHSKEDLLDALIECPSMHSRIYKLVDLRWNKIQQQKFVVKDRGRTIDPMIVPPEDLANITLILKHLEQHKDYKKHPTDENWEKKIAKSIGSKLSQTRYLKKKEG